MASLAPEWLFPLLDSNFRTARTSNRAANNYGFFCMTCMGDAIRELDKPEHYSHDILQAVKASRHFAIRVTDMVGRLNCDKIAKFSINSRAVYFLNSRVEPENPKNKNGKNKCEQNLKRSSTGLAPFKRYCTVCAWQLPEGDVTSLYCSLGCKFKSNNDSVINLKQENKLERNGKRKQVEEKNNGEQAIGVDSDQGRKNGEMSGMNEESQTKMKLNLRKRSRKGIPVRSPLF